MTTDELISWYEGKSGYLYHITDDKLIVYYGTLTKKPYQTSNWTGLMKFRTMTEKGETDYVIPVEPGVVYRKALWLDRRDDDEAIHIFIEHGNREIQEAKLKIKKIEKRNKAIVSNKVIKEGSYISI